MNHLARCNAGRRSLLFLIISFLLAFGVTACSGFSVQIPCSVAEDPQVSTLETILNRGRLICGVNGQRPGFSFQSPDGEFSGLDADFCRAIASALFDDPTQVEFRRVSDHAPFDALMTDKTKDPIDVLFQDTVLTLQADSTLPIEFSPPVFYDGQGLLAPATLKATTPADFEGKTVCVEAGTVAEATLRKFFQKAEVPIIPVAVDSENDVLIRLANRDCELATANRSVLAIRRQTLTDPDRYQLLDLMLSQAPLGGVVRDDGPQWSDIVKWIVYGTFHAEGLGLTQKNILQQLSSPDPEIRQFLGNEGSFGIDLGIPNDFMRRVVQHVGNYAEIYQRNLGEPFKLPRGANQLWMNGGLLYPLAFR